MAKPIKNHVGEQAQAKPQPEYRLNSFSNQNPPISIKRSKKKRRKNKVRHTEAKNNRKINNIDKLGVKRKEGISKTYGPLLGIAELCAYEREIGIYESHEPNFDDWMKNDDKKESKTNEIDIQKD